MELPAEGIHIRSRALITTLWARLVLGDLFLHGIGGAKYDQVTDALICGFFGLRPPGFMVLSATLHLPIQRPTADVERPKDIAAELRRLVYHPERYIDASNGAGGEGADGVAALIAEKRTGCERPRQRPAPGSVARRSGGSIGRCSRGSSRSGSGCWRFKSERPGRGGSTTCSAGGSMRSASIPRKRFAVFFVRTSQRRLKMV